MSSAKNRPKKPTNRGSKRNPYPAAINGYSTGTHKFGFQVGFVACDEATFFGEELAGSTHTLTFNPAYWFCYATALHFAVSLRWNGCEYELHALNAGPPYAGNFSIVCPTEQGIEMTALVFGETCSVSIPPQAGLEGVSLENTGEGSERAVQANLELTGINYTASGSACPTTGEFEDGTYNGPLSLHG